MLIEQHQLIDEHGAQRQQLRPLQTLDGYLHPPFKHVFEQPVERLDSLRPQFMERFAHSP